MSALLATVGLALLVAAAPAGSRGVKEGGIVTVGVRAFDYVDPALVPDPVFDEACGSCNTAMWEVEDATCAMLFRYPVTAPPVVRYDLVPEVATAYPAVSPDGKTYTFTIRKGFRFSNSAPVTAANYVRAFQRVLDPAMDADAARYLHEVVDVNAVGSRLIVHLSKRVPDFPARMTMPQLCPVPTDLPIAPEGVPAPLPGSGPYYVAEFVPGSRVVLRRNRFYRGSRAHHLDQIVVQIGDDQNVNQNKVKSGDVDVDLLVPNLKDIVARYGVNKSQFFSLRSADMFYLFMNSERPLFRDNPALRQAVNFALDRSAMLSVWDPSFGSTTDSYLPSGLPGYQSVHPYPVRSPDLQKAQELARGHTRSGKAVMYACDSVLIRCIDHARLVQAALKPIGIEVEIKLFPVTLYEDKKATRGEGFDLANQRVNVAWVDPYQYIVQLLDGRTIRATHNTNRSYFNSRYYNKLIDQAERLRGNARYVAYGKLAVAIARDAAPMAAWVERNTRFLVSRRVGCVRATGAAAHGLDLAGLCVK